MRIAHCSDLHLLNLGKLRLLDYANKRWIGGLNLLLNRGRQHKPDIFAAMVDDINAGQADHLVVTGDITNLGHRSEFEFARGHFDRLSLGPTAVTVLPGNHDAYVAEGVGHFLDQFEPFYRGDTSWSWPDGDPWPTVRLRGRVAIIGLSTSRRTPWFTCYGRLGERQLERLEAVLADDRLRGHFRVVALHHPPIGGHSTSKARGLRDRGAFAEILARHGAELVLHGHEHEALEFHLRGPDLDVPVRGIQSGTFVDGDAHGELTARYRIYETAANGDATRPSVVRTRTRVWRPELGQFAEEAAGGPGDGAGAGA